MLPADARHNPICVSIANPKAACYLGMAYSGTSKLPDGKHLLIREFRHAVRLAAAGGVHATALAVHVAHVIGIGSGKQMRGIHAGRIVASMADNRARFQEAACQLKGNMTGAKLLVTPSSSNAVPRIVDVAEPGPALVRAANVNTFPEPFRGCDRDPVMPKTVFLRLALYAPMLSARCPRQGRIPTTPTGAQSGSGRRVKLMAARVVPMHVQRGLALFDAAPRPILGIDGSLLAAPTMAVPVWNLFAVHSVASKHNYSTEIPECQRMVIHG